MQEASLPSPDCGPRGYHLRRIAAQVISAIQIQAPNYPSGTSPTAAKVIAFFDACSAAVDAASSGSTSDKA